MEDNPDVELDYEELENMLEEELPRNGEASSYGLLNYY